MISLAYVTEQMNPSLCLYVHSPPRVKHVRKPDWKMRDDRAK